MAPYSSTLAQKIPWMEEPGRLQSMGSLQVGRDFTFTFTFHFHALEKEMATHSSVLAWRIPGTAEPGGLPSMGHTESDTTEATQQQQQQSSLLGGEGHGNPLQYSCLENPMDGGSWQATVHRVTKSHTEATCMHTRQAARRVLPLQHLVSIPESSGKLQSFHLLAKGKAGGREPQDCRLISCRTRPAICTPYFH